MDLPVKWTAPTAIAASALAVFLGTGFHPIAWITWLAPLPLLWIAPRLSGRAAFLSAVLAWTLGGLNMLTYLVRLIGMPLPLFLLADVLPACIVGAALLFFRAAIRKGHPLRASLGFAAILVGFEFLQSLTSIHGTWGSVAYSQMDFLPIIQIASITGLLGISFLLLWVPAAIAARRRSVALAALGVIVVIISWGGLRLRSTPPPESSIVVGLASTDLPQNIFPHAAQAGRLLSEYATKANDLGAHGANLVLFPEKIGVVLDADLPHIDAAFEAAAMAHHMEILIGLTHITTTAKLNEARLYSADGLVEATYEKHHMLPPFESGMLVGTTRTILHQPSGSWGITICKDMDFPLLSRQYGQDGVRLLLVPAWDFNVDGWLHDRMAILRGVESGFTIVRAAKQGLLTVSDDRGRVLAQQSTASGPFASLVATVPVRHEATLYARFGDWFGWLSVALAVVLIAIENLLRFARSSPKASRPETLDETATAPQLR